jgi:hypothetical protein
MSIEKEREWIRSIRGAVRGGIVGKTNLLAELKPFYESFCTSNRNEDAYKGWVFDIVMQKTEKGSEEPYLSEPISISDDCICIQVDKNNCTYIVNEVVAIKIKYHSYICGD